MWIRLWFEPIAESAFCNGIRINELDYITNSRILKVVDVAHLNIIECLNAGFMLKLTVFYFIRINSKFKF
ncbi:hypothetical protein BUQ74_11855 [Leptospira weilii serovar Heyan]|nr:hypothetical protein BUQ74_11855 [Leptospira weilii serovar Heyan]